MFLVYSSQKIVGSYQENNIFGLAEELRSSYWFGLGLIITSLFLLIFSDLRNIKHEKLFLLEICLLALYLYSIPALVEENIYFTDTWDHSTGSLSILTQPKYGPEWYASRFPGAYFFQSISFVVTGVNPVFWMKYYPILFSVILVLIGYILLRKMVRNTRMVYFAMIFLVSGSVWVFPEHFCPNSLALIWYLMIFYFGFSRFSSKTIGLSIFLAITTVITNPTTLPFLILSILAILIAFSLLRKFGISKEGQKRWTLSFIFVAFLLISFLTWLMFNASDVFVDLVNSGRILASLNTYLSPQRGVQRVLTASPRLLVGQALKIIYSVLYVFPSAIGALYVLHKKRNSSARVFAAMGWVAACFCLGLATAFLQEGEFLERALLFSFIPLSVIAVMTCKSKYGGLILIIVLLIGTPLSIFAAYTNDYFEYSPISDSYGAKFMVTHGVAGIDNITKTSVGADYPTSTIIRFYILLEYPKTLNVNDTYLLSSNNTFWVWSQTSERFYFAYERGRSYEQVVATGSQASWIENYSKMASQPGFNLVYNNEGFMILLGSSNG